MPDITTTFFYIFLFSTLYLQVFFLVTFLEKGGSWRSPPNSQSRTDLPSVTIIVPCYNEEKTIAKTVQSLLALEYPKEKLSIFIIDDGSTDETFTIAKTFEGSPGISVFHKENGGKASALNMGIAKSTSRLIGCLDADAFVEPNALSEIVACFGQSDVMAVTPIIKVYEPKKIIQRIQRIEYLIGSVMKKSFSTVNALYVTPGPFSIYRREVFETLGPFRDAHNTEDLEIALRMQKKHLKIDNAHHAHVYTVAPDSVRKLYRQRTRWMYGFLKNAIDYRALLLNPKHGHVGLFSLPFALLSIASGLYFTGLGIKSFINFLAGKVTEWSIVGLSLGFDIVPRWYALNTEASSFLVYTSLLFILATIFVGSKIANDDRGRLFDSILFVLCYGLLAPLWLTRAIVGVLVSKQSSWR